MRFHPFIRRVQAKLVEGLHVAESTVGIRKRDRDIPAIDTEIDVSIQVIAEGSAPIYIIRSIKNGIGRNAPIDFEQFFFSNISQILGMNSTGNNEG
jgi:hypothetical protein